jgi:N-acyl-D-amino-acid deacylase
MMDLALCNGTIIDPVAQRLTVANLYCREGKIAYIGPDMLAAHTVIDASGLYVCPGFIDIHAHIDGNATAATLLHRQGVTTAVGGNCGFGPDDFAAFRARLNTEGFVINQMQLVGATGLRHAVGCHDAYVPLSSEQTASACALLAEQLDAGAAGLSFGLEYVPGSSREEIWALARVAARAGRPVSIHIRSDCHAGLDALREAIDICRQTGAGVQVSHMVYQFGFGMMSEALAIVEAALREGLDISCDSGMYTSFATYVGSAVFDPGCLERWGCTCGDLIAASGRYTGRPLTQEMFEELRHQAPDDVVIAMVGRSSEIALAFELSSMMASSDAGVNRSDDPSRGHPQDAGSFPRFIAVMVRELGQLSLADAIRRITVLPADRMGLFSKGRMELGSDADLTVFDLASIRDRSVFPHEGRADAPHEGIRYVVMGGTLTLRDGELLRRDCGQVITCG